MITQEKLKELMHYDPNNGICTWIKSARYGWVGKKVGTANQGYLKTRIDGKGYLVHRLAWLYMTGEWPSEMIDHVDMDGMNNRFSNLRLATRSENMSNRTRYRNNSTGFKNVYWHSRSEYFFAVIQHNHMRYDLGIFPSAELASEAVRAKRVELHGEFARHE